jgi:hypothetical protein
MFLLWQFGLVYTYVMVHYFINTAAQYASVVVASTAGNFSEIGPKVFLQPILGLEVGYRYIQAAETIA